MSDVLSSEREVVLELRRQAFAFAEANDWCWVRGDSWVGPEGYRVTLSRLECGRWALQRPGAALPFAYVATLAEVPALIDADEQCAAVAC